MAKKNKSKSRPLGTLDQNGNGLDLMDLIAGGVIALTSLIALFVASMVNMLGFELNTEIGLIVIAFVMIAAMGARFLVKTVIPESTGLVNNAAVFIATALLLMLFSAIGFVGISFDVIGAAIIVVLVTIGNWIAQPLINRFL